MILLSRLDPDSDPHNDECGSTSLVFRSAYVFVPSLKLIPVSGNIIVLNMSLYKVLLKSYKNFLEKEQKYVEKCSKRNKSEIKMLRGCENLKMGCENISRAI